MEKSYSQLSITELADRAEINRKTFYLHYTSLDDLVLHFQKDIADNFLSYVEEEAANLDVGGCIAKFYHYLDECDEVTQRLMCDEEYTFFYHGVTKMMSETEPFRSFYKDAKHPEIVSAYGATITTIFRNWLKSDNPMPIDELIDYACDMVLNGYNNADL